MKKCPKCAEQIQDDARVCRYCGHEFGFKLPDIGCGGAIALLILVLVVVSQCSPSTSDNSAMTDEQVEAIAHTQRQDQKIREANERASRWESEN